MSEQSTQEKAIDGTFLLDYYSRMRRIGAWVIIVSMIALMVFMVWSTAQEQTPPLDYNKLGVHLLLDDGRNDWSVDIWDEHLAYAGQISSSGGIAVQVIRADDLDPQRWQVFIDLCAEHDLTPVLRLATTFDFDATVWTAPQADESGSYAAYGTQYADFINALEWHTEQKHIILLNEPNNGHEWVGRPDAAAYATFVMDVAPILREQVEGLVLLNAALDLYAPNTGSQPFPDSDRYYVDANSFMDAMVAAQPEVLSQFDVWNSHAYGMGFVAEPSERSFGFDFLHDAVDTTRTPPPTIYNRGINGYEWELWKLSQYGIRDLPVMLTEVGWRHAESTDSNSVDAGDYPDAATIVQYMDLAMRGWASDYAPEGITWTAWLTDERVVAVAPFALNGVPHEWGHTNLLQLDTAGQVLGTYPVFDLLAGYPEK